MSTATLTALAGSLKQVTSILLDTTSMLLSVDHDSLTLGYDMLERRETIADASRRVTTGISSLSEATFQQPSNASTAMLAQYALFISAFEANLRATTSTMIRLQSKPSLQKSAYKGGAEPVVGVWAFMFGFCEQTVSWSPLMRIARVDHSPLHAAYSTLMTWQLGNIRSRAAVLQALAKQRESNDNITITWPHEPIQLLYPAVLCLLNLISLPMRDLCKAVHKLPSGFISTLCCLTCELLGSELSSQARPGARRDRITGEFGGFIGALSQVLGNLYTRYDSTLVDHPLNPELLSAATVATVKLSIVACSFTKADATSAVTTLCYLQDGIIRRDSINPSAGSRVNRPDLLPLFTVPNKQLLSVLGSFSLRNPDSLCLAAVAITNIMESDMNHVTPARIVSLPDLLSVCTQHIVRFMSMELQHRRQLKQQRRRQVVTPPSPHQKEDLEQLQIVLLRTMEGFILTPLQAPRDHRPQPVHPQILNLHSMPEWSKLHMWFRFPGSVSATEAVLRLGNSPTSKIFVSTYMHMTLTGLVSQIDKEPRPCFRIHTSLVNTLLKTLLLRSSKPAGLFVQRGDTGIVHQEMRLRDCGGAYMALCCTLLAVLERLNRGPRGTGSTSGSNNSRGNSNGGSSSSTSGSSEGSGSTSQLLTQESGLQQLKAVLVLGLVRITNLQLRLTEQERPGSARGCDAAGEFLRELTQQDPGMASVATGLLLQPSQAGKWRTEAAAAKLEARYWEGYAGTHLSGRVSPGCCHFGCTNLAGVSDASLPTQLCGGCRRVRYCSAACQREAWAAGGHGMVCGVAPGWTLPVS